MSHRSSKNTGSGIFVDGLEIPSYYSPPLTLGELYLHLEEKLLDVKNRDVSAYRIMRGNEQIGLAKNPRLSHGTRSITANDFRQNFHKIMSNFENDRTGYTVFVDGEPAACLFSEAHSLQQLEDATKILSGSVRQQEHQAKKTRSWIFRIFK